MLHLSFNLIMLHLILKTIKNIFQIIDALFVFLKCYFL